MGKIKSIERSTKRGLMRLLGGLLRARPMSASQVRDLRPSRILIIRQQNQMGDMLLAVPAYRAVRETFPEATIGVISSRLNHGVLEHCPFIDRLYTYDKRGPLGHFQLLREIRRERYDLVIVLHTVSFSFTSLALAVLSRARIRVGSTSPALGDRLTGSYLNLTLPLPNDDELSAMNETEHNLFPLRAIGIVTENHVPVLVPGQEAEIWADEFAMQYWDEGTVQLAVHPGAGKAENIWQPENFARAVEFIGETRAVSVVVVAGPSDGDAAQRFARSYRAGCTIVHGRPISDIAALLTRADLVLCNDTGVMHVAAAAGARTLAVFGPTDPSRWAPPCPNLTTVRSPDGQLTSLGAESVARSALAILGEQT